MVPCNVDMTYTFSSSASQGNSRARFLGLPIKRATVTIRPGSNETILTIGIQFLKLEHKDPRFQTGFRRLVDLDPDSKRQTRVVRNGP